MSSHHLAGFESQIDFVSDIITLLLQSIDTNAHSQLSEHFHALKDCLVRQDSQALTQKLHARANLNQTLPIIKAFTLYHMLLNIIEELNLSQNAPDSDNPESSPLQGSLRLSQAVSDLISEGYTKDQILPLLDHIKFYPVFTAHPTESRRRTFLEAHHQMSEDIKEIFATNSAQAKAHLLYRLHLLWHTSLVRSEKMEVLFELDNLLYIIESSILSAATQVLGEIESLSNASLTRSPIELGSWVGGDRDGNPFVSNEVLTSAMKAAHKSIIEVYKRKINALIRELSLSSDLITISPRLLQSLEEEREYPSPTQLHLFGKEPLRAKLYLMLKKLNNRLIAINTSDELEFSYDNSKAFLRDIDMLIESLDPISSSELKKLRHLVLMAGFHLLRLDFREHRDVILSSTSEIFCLLGLCDSDFKDLSEERKCEILNTALGAKKINLNTILEDLSEQSKRFVGAFLRIAWAKRHISESILQSFIISMSSQSSDLLCVLWFAKQSGLREVKKSRISIAPLFETIEDLQRAQGIIRALYANPHYKQYLLDNELTQEIMVGYSDSSKDGGIFASNFNLYQAIASLTKLQDELGIKISLFHGRGGSTSRGGGRLEEALLSSAPKSVHGVFKTTEQGEMISSKYLNPLIASRNFSSTLGALLKREAYDSYCIGSACEVNPSILKLLSPVSNASYEAYRALVYENKGFMAYFKAATPIEFIQNLNLGSRPSKRKDTTRVEDLRAIPWVFAWTQNRAIIPAWYGLGSGLKMADKVALKECFESSLFFKTTIDNISQALLKVDLSIAKCYNEFVKDKAVREEIWEQIYAQYNLTLEQLLYLRNESELLDSQRGILESISLRKPYLSVLNLAQIELIAQYQGSQDKQVQKQLLEQIHATIIGIAQGMRNTG